MGHIAILIMSDRKNDSRAIYGAGRGAEADGISLRRIESDRFAALLG
jgi:hypothetical protein